MRSGRRPLSQVVKRLSERGVERHLGIDREQTVSTKPPNNAYIINRLSCCEVLYPVETPGRKDAFVCRIYEHTRPLFSHPCDSRIRQIHTVDKRHTYFTEVLAKQLNVATGAIKLVLDNKIVFQGLLHQLYHMGQVKGQPHLCFECSRSV